MGPKKKIKMRTAEEVFGTKFIYDPEMDKLSKQVLFPKKLEEANKILTQVKFRHIKIK